MNENGEQRHYCLVKLSESVRKIQESCGQLASARDAYEKAETGSEKRQSRAELKRKAMYLVDTVQETVPLLEETGENSLAERAQKLYEKLLRFDYLHREQTALIAALQSFQDLLPTETNINAAALGRLMDRVMLGYYPTDLKHVDLLRQAVRFPETQTNLLDPCCGCGLALSRLAHGNNCVTYGAEIDILRRQEAQSRLDHVAFGSYFYSHISRDAFHCLFLNPPYLSVMKEQGSIRMEKAFLIDSIHHLVMDGLLIYMIPYYRATMDICSAIAGCFHHLSVYRFLNPEFSRFRQIVFLGRRKPYTVQSKLAQKLYQLVRTPQNLPELSEIPEGLYALPENPTEIKKFRGDCFNEMELAEHMADSGNASRLFTEESTDWRSNRPLLPLKPHQIGLIGSSGMVDGLIEGEHPHLVKGRIVKQDTINSDTKGPVEKVTSNRLLFRILTSEGYQSIA